MFSAVQGVLLWATFRATCLAMALRGELHDQSHSATAPYQSEAYFSKVAKTFGARKAIRKTPTRLFYKAGLSISCKGDKN